MSRPAPACDRTEPLLSAWLDGQLSAAEEGAVARHLSGCPRCWAEADDLRRIRTMIRGVPPRRAPEDVRFVLAGAVTPGPVARSPLAPGRRTGLVAAGAAATATMAAVLGSVAIAIGGEPAPGPAAVPLDIWVVEHLGRASDVPGTGPLSLEVGR